MAKDFDWDYKAAGDLFLRSEEIAQFCDQQAERMTRATGMEYKSDVHQGKTRVNARGYQKAEKGNLEKQGKWNFCNKCGRAHPNCSCKQT